MSRSRTSIIRLNTGFFFLFSINYFISWSRTHYRQCSTQKLTKQHAGEIIIIDQESLGTRCIQQLLKMVIATLGEEKI